MSLRPDEVANVDFPTGLKGWDREQVKAHLELVAAEYQKSVDESAHAALELSKLTNRAERLTEHLRIAESLRQTAEATAAAAEEERDRALARATETDLALGAASARAEASEAALAKARDANAAAAADAYTQLGDEVAQLLRSAKSTAGSIQEKAAKDVAAIHLEAEKEAAAIRLEAENTAAEIRLEAENAAEKTRLEVAQYVETARRESDRALLDAQQASADLRSQADLDARAEAKQQVDMAQIAAAALLDDAKKRVADANQRLDTVRTTERQLGERLEAVVVWIKHALASPSDELPAPPSLSSDVPKA